MQKQILTTLSYILVVLGANAQGPLDVLTGPPDSRMTVNLPSSVHPKALPQYDAGPVPGDLVLPRMTLLLRRSPAQEADLEALLAAQQDPQSPEYHHWLTPVAFGSRFGLSQNDLDKLSAWLRQGGFTIDEIPNGRWTVFFTGTVAQVQQAFHTAIHYYNVDGARHRANATPLQVPAAFSPVVLGVMNVHDFLPKRIAGKTTQPKYLLDGLNFLAPADFASIYDLNPLYSGGITGAGQSIAITGDCSISTTVVQNFRTLTGLAPNNTVVTIVPNVTPPSPCSIDEQVEGYLDAEWAGAVARGATINLVVAASLVDSLNYIVENDVAPVMSTSYAGCESYNQGAGNAFFSSLWQQAAARGITTVVASGDAGAAGCDSPEQTKAVDGLAVNGLCSPPYDVCVGGTEFNDGSTSQYWSMLGNALGYIPEMAWNESSNINGGSGLFASGGGYSTIYTKSQAPWQTNNTTNFRGVPDVSLSSASHDGYLLCVDNTCSATNFYLVSGTSASTPSFAGIMALIVQAAGQAQGNINSILYSLAASTSYTAFHDITTGNNSVPGLQGYSAGPGWDPVTGLGSIDANVLVNKWPGVVPVPEVALSVSSLAFGNQAVGAASTPQSITLTNGGYVALAISGMRILGTNAADFSETSNCGSSLAAGSVCTVMVTFQPTASGTRTANLAIYDNTIGSPQHILLTGTSMVQTITSLSPASVPAGSAGFALTVTGAGFSQGMTVQWNGTALTTTFVSATQLSASVPANLIASAGTATVAVLEAGVISNALVFTISPPSNVPVINTNGIVPIYSSVPVVQAGSWVTIYGSNLANGTFTWNGDFPTSLGGVSVTIDSKLAYLWYVSATLINLQVPDDTATGTVNVVVNTPSGTATSTVTLAPYGPSFLLQSDGKHVLAIVVTPGLPGNSGLGYDIIGPSRPVNPGETMLLFGVGFGPTTPPVPAGQVFSSAASTNSPVTITIGGVQETAVFAGIIEAGLYQINLTVPANTGNGDQPLQGSVNRVQTPSGPIITVQ